PGRGLRGDPVFEQFRASQNASLPVGSQRMDQINRAAGAALVQRIGPAIVLTHSRSGPFGWEIADDVPSLVRAIVAVEPNAPPVSNEAPLATVLRLSRASSESRSTASPTIRRLPRWAIWPQNANRHRRRPISCPAGFLARHTSCRASLASQF